MTSEINANVELINFNTPYKIIKHFVEPHKYIWAVAFFICFLGAVMEGAQHYSFKYIVDALQSADSSNGETIKVICLSFLPLLCLRVGINIVWFIEASIWAKHGTMFKHNIRMAIFEYIRKHSVGFMSDNFSGQMSQKITDIYVGAIEILADASHLVFSGFMALTSIVFIFSINYVVGAFAIIWFFVYLYISFKVMGIIKKKSYALADTSSYMSGQIVDVLTNFNIMKIFSSGKDEVEYLNKSSIDTRNKDYEFFITERNSNAIKTIMNTILFIGMFSTSLYSWVHNSLTVAEFVVILSYTMNWINKLSDIAFRTQNMVEEWSNCSAGLDTVLVPYQITDKDDAKNLELTNSAINIDNLTFSYKNGAEVFKNFSLNIKPNEKIALIGKSGAGKTTLANLILRLFKIKGGSISIDGQDIREVTQESLRKAIGLVQQDTSLFNRTLIENIRYGRKDATDEEVIEASKKARAHEFIVNLENGYNTMVGERGVKLSGGQRQRIAIARAILKDAPILVLDEATSALDSESEKYIQEGLKELMKGKTVIAIAHRLSTISYLDRIIVLENGNILENGTHEELLENDGLYMKLWSLQSNGFIQ